MRKIQNTTRILEIQRYEFIIRGTYQSLLMYRWPELEK